MRGKEEGAAKEELRKTKLLTEALANKAGRSWGELQAIIGLAMVIRPQINTEIK